MSWHHLPLPEHTMDALDKLHMLIESANWNPVASNENVSVYIRDVHETPCVMSKAYLRLVGVRPETAFHVLSDTTDRVSWDPLFDEVKHLETVSEFQDYLYLSMRTPIAVRSRDFCHLRTMLPSQGPEHSGVLLFEQAEHPAAPENWNKIRAKTVLSGYTVRQDCSSLTMQPCTLVTAVSQTDIRGSIPKAVCNAFASRAPLAWFKKFEQECHRLEAPDEPQRCGMLNLKKTATPQPQPQPHANAFVSLDKDRPLARRSDPGLQGQRRERVRGEGVARSSDPGMRPPASSTTVMTVAPPVKPHTTENCQQQVMAPLVKFTTLWHQLARGAVSTHEDVKSVRQGDWGYTSVLDFVQLVWWELETASKRRTSPLSDLLIQTALNQKSQSLLENLEHRDEADLLDAIMLIMQAEPSSVELVSRSLESLVPEKAPNPHGYHTIAVETQELNELGEWVSGRIARLLELKQMENDSRREEAEDLVCMELMSVLDKVEAHVGVGDWCSATLLLLTLVQHSRFETGARPGLAGRRAFKGFLHQMRVAWQSVLAKDDGLNHPANLPSRNEIADAMVMWDPTIEYRVPDHWGVLLNDRREIYFGAHPVEHALVEVLELWEKLRGHTIEAMLHRCGGEMDARSSELMQVSSDNMAILQAEAERLVMSSGVNSIASRIRCDLAGMVVTNSKIRGVFNNVQILLRGLEEQQRFPEVTSGSPVARAMSSSMARGSVEECAELGSGQHFWHQLTASKLSCAVETTQAAVTTCLELCHKVEDASLPQRKMSEDKCQKLLVEVQSKLEKLLQRTDIPISSVLQAMVTSAITMQQGINDCYIQLQQLELLPGCLSVFDTCSIGQVRVMPSCLLDHGSC
eukprot:TRINITY_DN11307_c0_g2_i2.p1 TRINITY_DN11307_c0_g2~~TRINITY_DN11307_c0_g2_i2.p1  ORF type:complete len:860 (-),score=132.53 TRINITY_DN11307_c0_g2_i2:228-2807(-)